MMVVVTEEGGAPIGGQTGKRYRRVNVVGMRREEGDAGVGVVATLAGGDSGSGRNPRANCTSAGVGWAAGAECGRNAVFATEPFTQRGERDRGGGRMD